MRRFLVGLVLIAGLMTTVWLFRSKPKSKENLPEITLEDAGGSGLFARAVDVRSFHFPEDLGPHLEYQTEWWYYTGNLETSAGDHFGFQLTFFRRGLTPDPPERASVFAASQIYFAHFAITDVGAGEHVSFERFSRGAAGLAGAESPPYRLWLESWSVESVGAGEGAVRLQAAEGDFAIDLTLQPRKPIVAHGDRGLSPKGESSGNASYYLSYTRMEAYGTVATLGGTFNVSGESWFDHEWSTSALGPEAVGWDWFGLQLSDGRELMVFQIRRQDGSVEPISGGTLVGADGEIRTFEVADLAIQTLETWTSPGTGARYPSRWRLTVPSLGVDLSIEPWLQDQEMQTSFVYWEGAVRMEGTSAGLPVTGQGYVELTGYLRSMQGVF